MDSGCGGRSHHGVGFLEVMEVEVEVKETCDDSEALVLSLEPSLETVCCSFPRE